MSIIHAFDGDSEDFLKAGFLSGPEEGFPKTVMAVFRPSIVELVKERFDTVEMGEMECIVPVPVYCFSYQGHRLGIYLSMLGGPAAVGLMEETASMGAEKFLVFGSVGILNDDLTAGRLIIPSAAYRDEGTSYHYMPPSDYVDIPTATQLAEIFTELGYPYVLGKIWTTDALFRETHKKIAARRKDGCLAVDMECASLMAAGQFRNIPVYQFVYGEDSLYGDEWDAGNAPDMSDNEKYLQILLETAIRL